MKKIGPLKTGRFAVITAMINVMFAAGLVWPAAGMTPEEARAHLESAIAAMKAHVAGLGTNAPSSGVTGSGGGTGSGAMIGSGPMDPTPNDFPTNAPYLTIVLTRDTNSNAQAALTLHGTSATNYYQLISKPSLDVAEAPFWTPGQWVFNDSGTNQILFDPLLTGDSPAMFFRGVSGDTIVGIKTNQFAVEPNAATGYAGQPGLFKVSLNQALDRDLTVYYRACGSAINGVDYTNVPGTVTILAGQDSAFVPIEPVEDGHIDFEESVVLTLVGPTNGYLIDPDNATAVIRISEICTDSPFRPTVTGLNGPTGIDYHVCSNSLIVSYNYDLYGSLTPNFLRIYTNVVFTNGTYVTNTVATGWSGIGHLPDEVKLTTVKYSVNGFTNGDMYFSSTNGIGWLSADATRSNLAWCTLTNGAVTNALPVRGGLYVDETGLFSNNLIAVTSDSTGAFIYRGVWMIDAQGRPRLLAQILCSHLEGAITLPNDAARFGRLAGKIITGDELELKLYAIAPDGTVTGYNTQDFYPGGIGAEDFDIIQTNQDLYCRDQVAGAIFKLPASYLSQYAGDLLITAAGEFYNPASLFIVRLECDRLVATTRIGYLHSDCTSLGNFEHVTFAPINIPTQ
jgi:hypothetical protein